MAEEVVVVVVVIGAVEIGVVVAVAETVMNVGNRVILPGTAAAGGVVVAGEVVAEVTVSNVESLVI